MRSSISVIGDLLFTDPALYVKKTKGAFSIATILKQTGDLPHTPTKRIVQRGLRKAIPRIQQLHNSAILVPIQGRRRNQVLQEAAFVFLVARKEHRVVGLAAQQVGGKHHGAVGLGHFRRRFLVAQFAQQGDAVAQGAEVGWRQLRQHLFDSIF